MKPIKLDANTIANLGRSSFLLDKIGRRLHELKLYNVDIKIEDGQAAAIHFLMAAREKYGDNWLKETNKILSGDN